MKMIESALLESANFQRSVDQQIATRINPIAVNVNDLKNENEAIRKRLAALEKRN
jgi:Trp operon repressor